MVRAHAWLTGMLSRESGQALVEYLLIVGVVAIGMLSVLTTLSTYMNGPFREFLTQNLNLVSGMK